MGHHITPNGDIYADTAFLQAAGRISGVRVEHLGFGEFYLDTPKGQVEFDRMRGKDFPGKSGRSHLIYDKGLSKAGPASLWVISEAEKKGLSEKTATTKIASPQDLQAELNSILAYAQKEKPSRRAIEAKLRTLASLVAAS